MDLPVARVGTSRHPVIGNPIDFVASESRRRDRGHLARGFPGDMGFGYILVSVHPHSPKLGFEKSRAEIYHSVAEDWTGAGGESPAMMDAPDFFPRQRL